MATIMDVFQLPQRCLALNDLLPAEGGWTATTVGLGGAHGGDVERDGCPPVHDGLCLLLGTAGVGRGPFVMEVRLGNHDSRGLQGGERRKHGTRYVYCLICEAIGGPYSE